ncbi:MAG: ABC transporter ATP-binding protein, partial [Vibrio toranzoniae]
IGRALVVEPDLLILDEPTGSLDERNAEAVMRLLTSLTRQLECTLLLVTHSEKVALHMDGRIRLQGGQLHVMARS